MRLNWSTMIPMGLAILGALNWGSVGLFNFNFVRNLLGTSRTAEKTVYTLVGVAGLFTILYMLFPNMMSTMRMPGMSEMESQTRRYRR